jgi:hypothetical protein
MVDAARTRRSPPAARPASPETPAATETWAHLDGVRYRVRRAPTPVHAADGPLLTSQERASRPPPCDYTVGYGKPPEHARFKKGQSGNPRGRPKGSKNLLTLIQEELDRPIAVREDGRSRKVRAREALVKRLVHKGLSGHDRSIETLLKLDHGAVAPAETTDGGAEPLTPGGRSILEAHRRQIIEEHEITSRAAGADTADEQGGAS